MQEVHDFLKAAGHYFLATAEGDQPRVRPFGTALIFDGRLYFQTSHAKNVSRQMAANPKVELSAFLPTEGRWLRVAATAVNDDRVEVKRAMLDAQPSLKDRYKAEDPQTQVLWLKDATATFESFAGEKKTVRF